MLNAVPWRRTLSETSNKEYTSLNDAHAGHRMSVTFVRSYGVLCGRPGITRDKPYAKPVFATI
jgi:hypothetical protein